MPDFASRLTGSSDLYADDGRSPIASVNFVTCHDGFTLHDLVSYDHKHNDANGEANRDGTDDNRSWNCGFEGPTDDPEINALRERQKRNLLTTVFLSQGVPMISHGDEIGRTQHGNNNVYCQDNELSWVHWDHDHEALTNFVRRLAALHSGHPVFRRRRFFHGRAIRGVKDLAWFTPGGREMSDDDWSVSFANSVGVFLNGDAIAEPDRRGEPIRGDSFLLLFNADDADLTFTFPPTEFGAEWVKVLDTADPLLDEGDPAKAGETTAVESRSVQVHRRV